MGYTADDTMVRVDFFKPSGKYYTTEAVKWLPYDRDKSISIDIFKKSLKEHLGTRLNEMTAVMLESEVCGFPMMVSQW